MDVESVWQIPFMMMSMPCSEDTLIIFSILKFYHFQKILIVVINVHEHMHRRIDSKKRSEQLSVVLITGHKM